HATRDSTARTTQVRRSRVVRAMGTARGYRGVWRLIGMVRMADHLHPRHEERAAAHPLPWTRRRFLERSAMAVAGGVLFSCTHGGKVISRVSSSPAATVATQWPVKHVIYVMLENRSFNNLFGMFPGVESTRVG